MDKFSIAFGAFALALLWVWVFWRKGLRLGFADLPSSRGLHAQPTPRGAGGAIAVAWAFFRLAEGFAWQDLSLLGFFLLGLADDFRPLPAISRLVAQFLLAAFWLWASGETGFPFFFFLFFIAATSNFYNFMDGANGMAALSGLAAFGWLFFWAQGGWTWEVLAVILGILAFLPFNFPRARVFMGDAGSLFLGAFFAASCIRIAKGAAEFLFLAGLLFPFYADTLTTLFFRWQAKKNLLSAHREHLYQILVHDYGFSHPRVSLGYLLLQAVAAAAFSLVLPLGLFAVLCCWFFFFLGFFLLSRRLRQNALQSP